MSSVDDDDDDEEEDDEEEEEEAMSILPPFGPGLGEVSATSESERAFFAFFSTD
jgi:hypothetical protein